MKYYLQSWLQPNGKQEEIWLPQVEPGSQTPEGCFTLLLASDLVLHNLFQNSLLSVNALCLCSAVSGILSWPGKMMVLWLLAVSITLEEGRSCCWNPKEIDIFAETPLVSLNGPEVKGGPAWLFAEVFILQWLLSDPETARRAQNHWKKAVPKGCTRTNMVSGSAAWLGSSWIK